MSEPLKYLSLGTLDALSRSIGENLGRYRDGSFADLVPAGDWSIPLRSCFVDLAPLRDLDPSGEPDAEVANSLLVWRVFGQLTPSLACEDRIWTRLCHVECLDYARKRWLDGTHDDNAAIKAIEAHFFAGSLTRCRDDNAISRLWWNAFIAFRTRPHDQEKALKLILARADVRSNFVERPMMCSRKAVGDGVLRAMECHGWITAGQDNYRRFMVALNRIGSGVVFELMKPSDVDGFMKRVLEHAENERQLSA
ncbi:MAG: hypothetical protein J0M16_01360 [Gammaproteobacteria bacterium]|nr:hypothetical protein [Gammaproteobacteria bacterium]